MDYGQSVMSGRLVSYSNHFLLGWGVWPGRFIIWDLVEVAYDITKSTAILCYYRRDHGITPYARSE